MLSATLLCIFFIVFQLHFCYFFGGDFCSYSIFLVSLYVLLGYTFAGSSLVLG